MKRIILFDVDGTLTKPRKKITPEMCSFLDDLSQRVTIGLVGGSDLVKIEEQMGPCVAKFEYVFSQNGLVAFKRGAQVHNQSLLKFVGEKKLQELINFSLRYIADLKIPHKRGTFVEFRQGMLNICPVGRNCSQEERDAFGVFDSEHKVRARMVEALKDQFSGYGITFAIGGQISIDVFPDGWNKTYCLKMVEEDGFDEIHFFGDKTHPGGNDHEIFNDPRTNGHTVTSPDDTMRQVKKLLEI
ncbi:phosphomannomutase 2-like [Tropilaelaps mercedesae]|uniref:Phosphomannomutase n=1 Tax=Tropilaelaps mercedesae TaxID=418985 RepID=A0A1V9XHX8_9ACAR|nr:phosphomannomutase 2-like [Tropilaelaps mercedesae]